MALSGSRACWQPEAGVSQIKRSYLENHLVGGQPGVHGGGPREVWKKSFLLTLPRLGMVNPPQVWLAPRHTPGMASHRSYGSFAN